MSDAVYIVTRCCVAFIDAISIAMLLRAILSWIFTEENKVTAFLYVVTEPIVLPIRALCERFGWFRGVPIDIPFFITMITLSILSTVLETSFGVIGYV